MNTGIMDGVAARNQVLRSLKRGRWGIASTENERRLGSDLWCKARDGRTVKDLRVEVKGLSSHRRWDAKLTHWEQKAAANAVGTTAWFLVVVTNAQSDQPAVIWLSVDEVVAVWHTDNDGGVFRGDPVAAKSLGHP